MQLPRGTFREIKKKETIESILAELERTRFSGICSISSAGAAAGTLVFNRGKCILVKFQGKTGDAGWDELYTSLNEEVDAALSTLDDAQVQLSLEFNKACRLVRGGKAPAPQPVKPSPPAERQVHTPARHEPVRKPAPSPSAVPPLKPAPRPAAAHAAVHTPATPRIPAAAPEQVPPKAPAPAASQAIPRAGSQIPPAPRAPRVEEVPAEDISEAGQSAGSFEKDIDTFDTMDLENVTDKIRNDCKTMIKQLHLEHLMER